MLNIIRHGPVTDRPPLLIVHGLFGSARNWGVIAKRLADERQVLAVDMRNHGTSGWTDTHTYPEMAADLARVIAEESNGAMDVVGHSMGGKAAMMLALEHPESVRRLLVADIAPVAYGHSQQQFIDAMKNVDLSTISRRSEAAQQLAAQGVDPALQSFFTQSLDVKDRRWLLNLQTLERDMPHILSFPQTDAIFERPTLFLAGSESDYVKADHRSEIRRLFPKARFATMKGAGHWLHADDPRGFEASVRAFLGT